MLKKILKIILIFFIFSFCCFSIFQLYLYLEFRNHIVAINQIFKSLPEQEKKLPLKVKQFLINNYEKSFYENKPYQRLLLYYHSLRGKSLSELMQEDEYTQPITKYVILGLMLKILSDKERKSFITQLKWSYTIPKYIDKEKILSFFSRFLFNDYKGSRGLAAMAQKYLQKNLSELTEKDLEKLVEYSINRNRRS